jgi:translocation protein SEC63
VGTYTLRLLFVSDTFVGEDVGIYIQLKVEDVSALKNEEQDIEDDISEPDEDSLAGQMALMRGGPVKRSDYHGGDGSGEERSTDDEEGDSTDDDESSTDDDEDSDTESSDDDD